MNFFYAILLLLISFGSIHSQNSFYIKPILNTKFGIASTNGFFQFSKHYPQNDYFQVFNKSIHYIPGLHLGLGFGWKNEKNRFSLELTWSQDMASIANETVLLTTNGDNNYYYNTYLPYRIGFSSNRFSLNLNKLIFKDLIEIDFGVGFIYLSGGNENYEFIVDPSPFLYNSTSTLKLKYTTRAVSNLNLNLSVGLGINLKFNDFELFTLSTIYYQGLKQNLIIHENYYELSDFVTNDTLKYSYSSASKGSGIVIQISRKFQLYPWKSRAKKGV